MAIAQYEDFVIQADDVVLDEFSQLRSFSVQVFDSPVGQGERKEIVEAPLDLAQRLDQYFSRQLDQQFNQQIALGEVLAQLLFPPAARQMISASLLRLSDGQGLRLRLRLADELGALPWEMVYLQEARGEPTASGFLALDTRVSIVRDFPLPFPPDAEQTPPVKRSVLVAMASPRGLPALPNLPQEQATLKAALDGIAGLETTYLPDYSAALAEQRTARGATMRALSETLLLSPRTDIFHFGGHGVFRAPAMGQADTSAHIGMIALEDENGDLDALPADRLCEILRSQGVRLALFTACQTGQRDVSALWNSIAIALLKARLPAVVAMQSKLRDDLAPVFSGVFYRALVAGYPLDYAVAAGRMALRNAARDDAMDWSVPVLYRRSGDFALFQPVNNPPARRQAEQELPEMMSVQVNQNIGQAFGAVIGELHGNIENITSFEADSEKGKSAAGDIAQPSEQVCSACGHVNLAGTNYCEMCGAALALARRYCAQCGQLVSLKANFCLRCGARLEPYNG